MNTEMTPALALPVLAAAKAQNGRRFKSQINLAWMTGDYTKDNLGAWSSQLQRIRNTLGPTWLANVNV